MSYVLLNTMSLLLLPVNVTNLCSSFRSGFTSITPLFTRATPLTFIDAYHLSAVQNVISTLIGPICPEPMLLHFNILDEKMPIRPHDIPDR